MSFDFEHNIFEKYCKHVFEKYSNELKKLKNNNLLQFETASKTYTQYISIISQRKKSYCITGKCINNLTCKHKEIENFYNTKGGDILFEILCKIEE